MAPDCLNGLIIGGIEQHGYCLVDLLADLLAVRVPPDVDHLGLAEGAVQLALAPDVDAALAGEIAAMADRIADGTLPVPTTYDGPEMDLAS